VKLSELPIGCDAKAFYSLLPTPPLCSSIKFVVVTGKSENKEPLAIHHILGPLPYAVV
jgi:hypothetical protein